MEEWMATEAEHIADQLQRAVHGPAWHGPAVLEMLDGVDAQAAAAHPIPGAHSIWELVLHITATYDLVRQRLQGEAASLTPEDDWRVVAHPTEEAWRQTVQDLKAANAAMQVQVRSLSAAQLEKTLPAGELRTTHVQLVGLAEHDLYHAGQMALLKKLAAR
jgi:uncharacterized damage-inducible protein DinB